MTFSPMAAGQNICANLDHARLAALCRGENGGEIKIGGQQDVRLFCRPTHQFRVGLVAAPDIGPVNRLKSGIDKKINPARRQIHVDQDAHQRVVSSISRSSARQAA